MPDVDTPDQDRYEARLGEVLRVRLPENASTGYVWSLVSLGDGLDFVDAEIQHGKPTDSESRPAPGAAHERVFQVRANRPGVWPVELRLARSWESTPLQERRLTVTVS